MTSVERAMSGIASRSRSTVSRKLSTVWRRSILRSVRLLPDWRGRWSCSQTPRLVGHDFDEFRRDIVGMRRREADPPDPVDTGDFAEQPGKAPAPRLVGVDGLAEERDLGHAGGAKFGHLAQDVARCAVLLRPADVGHDAEGAPVVAPALDRDPRGRSRAPPDPESLVVLVPVQVEDSELRALRPAAGLTGPGRPPDRAAAPDLGNPLREGAVAVGPHDEVHVRSALEERVPHALRHAAGDPENHLRARLFQPFQLGDPSEHAALRVFADRACVDEHQVGLGRLADQFVSARAEDPLHQLAVSHIHLAPVGLDVRAPRGGSDRLHDPN